MVSQGQIALGIIGVYVAVMLVIGYVSYRYRKVGELDEFFLMGRELTPFIGILTIFATFQSGYFMFGAPGFYYSFGFPFFYVMIIEVGLITAFIWLFGSRIWVLGQKYGHMTISRVFGHYYDSKWVRYFIVFLTAAFLTLYIDVQLIAGGVALEGISQGIVSFEQGVVIMGLFIAGYTVIGGFRAVAWTDTLQGGIFFGGAFVLAVWFILQHGGIGGFFTDLAQQETGALTQGGLLGTPFQSWVWTHLAFVLSSMLTFAFQPQFAQRIMAADSLKTLRKMSIGAGFITWFGYTLLIFVAFGILMAMPGIGNPDTVVPTFVGETFPIWGSAFIAAAIAAMMSTSDSLLISISSAVVDDFYRPAVAPGASSRHYERVSWVVIGVVMTASVGIAFIRPAFIVDMTIIAFTGFIPLLWMMIGLMFWRGATSEGAIASVVVNTATMIVVYGGLIAVPTQTSGFDYALYAFPLSGITFFVVSAITNDTATEDRIAEVSDLFNEYLP